ncbi:MAG: hypothetical protein AAF823_09405 [Planctomycetota bacterium]
MDSPAHNTPLWKPPLDAVINGWQQSQQLVRTALGFTCGPCHRFVKKNQQDDAIRLAILAISIATALATIYLVGLAFRWLIYNPDAPPTIDSEAVALVCAALLAAAAALITQRFVGSQLQERQAAVQQADLELKLYDLKVQAYARYMDVLEWYHTTAFTIGALRVFIHFYPPSSSQDHPDVSFDAYGRITPENAVEECRRREDELRAQPSLESAGELFIAQLIAGESAHHKPDEEPNTPDKPDKTNPNTQEIELVEQLKFDIERVSLLVYGPLLNPDFDKNEAIEAAEGDKRAAYRQVVGDMKQHADDLERAENDIITNARKYFRLTCNRLRASMLPTDPQPLNPD